VGRSKKLEGLTGAAWFEAKHGREPRREPVKCKLPSCENWTDHNGGYCCPEHCVAHKELRKSVCSL